MSHVCFCDAEISVHACGEQQKEREKTETDRKEEERERERERDSLCPIV